MSALILTLLAWYACGIVGFLYWWTEDGALDDMAVLDSLGFGIMGPLNLLLGYLVHRLMIEAPEESETPAAGRSVSPAPP